jgi:hypothetical protein
VTEFLRSRIQSEFVFTTRDNDVEETRDDAAGSDEEAELVLFAGPLQPGESHKIRLSSPEANADPGLLVKKPRSYYIADEVTSEKEAEYTAAAVTGADVLNMAKIPWPASVLPWKVRTITPAGLKKIVLIGHPPDVVPVEVEETPKKRTRKGKKSRIALRKKMQATNDKQAEQARLAQEKAEADREKRTRRNREKKVKRKARDQAKKGAATGPEDPTPASPGSET